MTSPSVFLTNCLSGGGVFRCFLVADLAADVKERRRRIAVPAAGVAGVSGERAEGEWFLGERLQAGSGLGFVLGWESRLGFFLAT